VRRVVVPEGSFARHCPIPAAWLVLAGLPVLLDWRWLGLVLGLVVGLGLVAWFSWRPESFDRWTVGPVRAWLRRRRYRSRWLGLMAGCELVVTDHRRRVLAPRIASIKSGRFADVLTLKLPDGLTADRVSDALPAIAEAMRAGDARFLPRPPWRLPAWFRCRIPLEFHPGSVQPGTVRVRLAFGDPLVSTVTMASLGYAPDGVTTAAVDLEAVPFGRCDDGRPATVPLLGTHVLISGATGSGKGSVLWALLAAVGPAIRDGRVIVFGIDPKGGMELGVGAGLFARLITMDGPSGVLDTIEFLEQLADYVDARAARLAGRTRRLIPTPEDPFVLVVIDELASVTAFIPDSKLKLRAEAALGRLLTKGRAPGYCVIGAVQDPRKEVVRYRDLFPTRIGLRLVEPAQVDLALGDGARKRGARCDLISDTAPGVGYLLTDGSTTVTRIRAAYLEDDTIRQLATNSAPPAATAATGLPRPARREGHV
jgi:S-DNA-T family DNA segregation ATPase FtsK/SpoIIIE